MRIVLMLVLCCFACACKSEKQGAAKDAGAASKDAKAAVQVKCQRDLTLQRLEFYTKSKQYEKTIALADAYLAKCKDDYYRFHWEKYSAHKRLLKWDLAVKDASKLIAHAPNDKDYRWWRGIVYEKAGNLELAADDYRDAILLEPKLRSIPFNLADVLERLKKPCQALRPIQQYLYYYPKSKSSPRIKRRVDRLLSQGNCDLGTGSPLTLRGNKKTGVFLSSGKIDGAKAKLAVDDRSAYVIVSKALAEKAKLSVGKEQLSITTNSGVFKGRVTAAREIQIGKLKAKDVAVFVADEVPEGVDGLLGLSFLSRFDVKLDTRKKRMKLTPRKKFTLGGVSGR